MTFTEKTARRLRLVASMLKGPPSTREREERRRMPRGALIRAGIIAARQRRIAEEERKRIAVVRAKRRYARAANATDLADAIAGRCWERQRAALVDMLELTNPHAAKVVRGEAKVRS